MPRPPRFGPAGIPQHVIQRGNNRSTLFAHASDFRFFRDCLRAACERHRCQVHAYVLMINHVHLLVTPASDMAVSKVMQAVGVRYVQHFNKTYGRTGTLWEGRYRATLVDTERYLFTCHRYIELNPVRAGLVNDPRDYPWSSHAANALGTSDSLVTPHGEYHALDTDASTRRAAYRALFDSGLSDSVLEEIRVATNTGWALGSKQFREEVAALVGHRTERLRARLPRA